MGGAQAVLADWRAGLRNHHFWLRFGVLDIKLRYRRTVLGPFWVTLSFAVSAAALGLVYSALFRLTGTRYLAYLVTGLAVWGLLASLVTEGCTSFIRHANLIQQHRLPLMAHALRSVATGFLTFLHSLIVVAAALLFLRVEVGWRPLLAAPALALVLGNGLWVALLLGMLCARFRDLPQVVSLLLNLTFFVTPVFWYRDMLGSRAYIADYNPLYSFLELVRAPLLGDVPPGSCLWVALAITAAGWLATLLVACRLQPRLTYWV